MAPKYRLLLAFLLTLLTIYSQTVLAQSKKIEQFFTVLDQASCNCSLTVTPTISNSSICDKNDGEILITPSGGSGDFSFKWKDQSGQILTTAQNLTNVLPGNYYLEVVDNKAPYCGSSAYGYSISSPLSIIPTVQDNDGCTIANGAIAVNVTGGSGKYGFAWKFPDGTETQIRNLANLKAGAYLLTVTDLTFGCTVSKTISIKSKNQLAITVNALKGNSSCIMANGNADISIIGGSGQYVFYWYDLNTFGLVSSSEDLQNVKGGSYSLFVTDFVSGCSGYEYITIPELAAFPQYTLSDIISNTQCSGPFNGAANLEISGTPGPYEVTWTDGTNIVSNLEDPINLSAGIYGFTIKDTQTKCQTSVSPPEANALKIDDKSLPIIEVSLDALTPNSMCESFDGAISVSITDPKVPYTYAWTGPGNFTSSEEDIIGLSPGLFILTIEATCNMPPVIEQPAISLSSTSLRLNMLEFITDPDDNLNPNSFEIIQQPISQAIATITADYYLNIDYGNTDFKGVDNLRIKACDLLNACTENSFSLQIESSQGEIIVYNAIAPNSTGNNKFMRIQNLPSENKVSVFNRWGDLVFGPQNYSDETPGKRFDGFGLDGRSLPTGTYFYKIEFEDGRSDMIGFLALKQ